MRRKGFEGDYILLYQNGIANVVRFRDMRRVLQHCYRVCEDYCRGLIEAGKRVEVMHCDVLGDVLKTRLGQWRAGPGPTGENYKRPLEGYHGVSH
jgi:hypothetical protein